MYKLCILLPGVMWTILLFQFKTSIVEVGSRQNRNWQPMGLATGTNI